MRQINNIFLPEEEIVLQTDDLKIWLKYCKLQYKKFKCVVDSVGEWGIWSRNMRLYSKQILSYQTSTRHVKVWTKNCEMFNNIRIYQIPVDFTELPDEVDLLRINGDRLSQFIQSKRIVPFVYVDNFPMGTEIGDYKILIQGINDKILYQCK